MILRVPLIVISFSTRSGQEGKQFRWQRISARRSTKGPRRTPNGPYLGWNHPTHNSNFEVAFNASCADVGYRTHAGSPKALRWKGHSLIPPQIDFHDNLLRCHIASTSPSHHLALSQHCFRFLVTNWDSRIHTKPRDVHFKDLWGEF